MNHSSASCVLPASLKKLAPTLSTDSGTDESPGPGVVDSCGSGPWCDRTDAILDLEGMHVIATDRRDPTKLVLQIETSDVIAWCRTCGTQAKSHARRSVPIHDAPTHGKPVVLHWRKRIFRCHEKICPKVTFTEEHPSIGPREKLTVRAIHWAFDMMKKQDVAVSALARQLGVDWHTIWDNIAPLAALEYRDPTRLEGINALGVDEHVWRHTGFPSGRVITGMIDHTRDTQGKVRARLLDLVPGRSGKAYGDWLKEQPTDFIQGIKVATLDPFRGYANAIDEQLPEAIMVLDAFHVVKLGTSMVDDVRRRVQNETTGHRGRKDDPLFKSRRLLLQGVEHLENKQLNKLRELLDAGDPEGAVTVAWHAYQDLRMIYHVKLTEGSTYFLAMLEKYSDCPIPEIKRLCKTLKNWKEEICAYFKTDGASNGPTEAINGVIETIRRVARGFRNFENYRLRSLMAAGGHRTYRT